VLESVIPWLVGAGGIAAVVGLFFLNPLAMARFFSAVAGLVLDKARAFIQWCRDPGRNWWKVGCLSFGACFTVAALVATERHEAVAVEVAAKTAQEAACGAAKTELGRQVDTASRNFLACQKALEREVGLPDQVDAMNAEALAAAKAEARKAKAEAEAWRQRYASRPQTCTAALAEVEKQCASFSDY
jgi:hypothetical protein